MRFDPKGRAFCKVMDQDSRLCFEISAEVYDVLCEAVRQKLSGVVEFKLTEGNVAWSTVSITGKEYSKNVPRGIGALIPGSQQKEVSVTT